MLDTQVHAAEKVKSIFNGEGEQTPKSRRPEYQQRVVEEKTELDTRLEKLCMFSNTALFANLPVMEQERMNVQRHLMCAYSAVLGARIAEFEH